ncbi:hypothetical protein Anapl_10319 [Anas platyrhynchos]|uniref:Uncharacterized protein n=1 Tax=Anas platyrhynchos TaxID=8839 RepID=R0LGA7_ANAPL|nr:hypothetical protein Anapl_10319 [Anas platyrhynchos]
MGCRTTLAGEISLVVVPESIFSIVVREAMECLCGGEPTEVRAEEIQQLFELVREDETTGKYKIQKYIRQWDIFVLLISLDGPQKSQFLYVGQTEYEALHDRKKKKSKDTVLQFYIKDYPDKREPYKDKAPHLGNTCIESTCRPEVIDQAE